MVFVVTVHVVRGLHDLPMEFDNAGVAVDSLASGGVVAVRRFNQPPGVAINGFEVGGVNYREAVGVDLQHSEVTGWLLDFSFKLYP